MSDGARVGTADQAGVDREVRPIPDDRSDGAGRAS